MRQPLLQKASSQSAAICAHSERGDLYHGMQPSGNGRQQRKLSELAALTARDGWSAGPFFLHFPEKKISVVPRSPAAPIVYPQGQTARQVRSMKRPRKPTFPNCALTVTY